MSTYNTDPEFQPATTTGDDAPFDPWSDVSEVGTSDPSRGAARTDVHEPHHDDPWGDSDEILTSSAHVATSTGVEPRLGDSGEDYSQDWAVILGNSNTDGTHQTKVEPSTNTQGVPGPTSAPADDWRQYVKPRNNSGTGPVFGKPENRVKAIEHRATVLSQVAMGKLTPNEVISMVEAGTDESRWLSRIRLRDLLLAQPGVGPKTVERILQGLAGTEVDNKALTIKWLVDRRVGGRRWLHWLDLHQQKVTPWAGYPMTEPPALLATGPIRGDGK